MTLDSFHEARLIGLQELRQQYSDKLKSLIARSEVCPPCERRQLMAEMAVSMEALEGIRRSLGAQAQGTIDAS